jgi:hypothetical protein
MTQSYVATIEHNWKNEPVSQVKLVLVLGPKLMCFQTRFETWRKGEAHPFLTFRVMGVILNKKGFSVSEFREVTKLPLPSFYTSERNAIYCWEEG